MTSLHKLLVNLVPFSYAFNTRIASGKSLLGLLSTEHLFVLFVVYVGTFGSSFTITSFIIVILRASLAYIAFYALYEVGYLVNDHFSIRYEANPTIRETGGVHVPIFIVSRIAWFLIVVLVLAQLFRIPSIQILVPSGLLLTVEFLHNFVAIRVQEARFYTFIVLRLLRYTFVVSLLVPGESLNTVVIMLPPLAHSLMTYLESHWGHAKELTVKSFVLRYSVFLPLQVFLLGAVNLILILPNLIILITSTLFLAVNGDTKVKVR